jgi:hypothetical protein
MPEQTPRTLWDQWIWERGARTAIAVAIVAVSAIAVLILLPHWGVKTTWLLPIGALVASGHWLIYSWVGGRVESLRASVPKTASLASESRIVIGLMESPGIAAIDGENLLLLPIVGTRVSIPLREIQGFTERKWFNGNLLIGKTGFRILRSDRKRLAFAVGNCFADQWRRRLKR